MRLKIYMLFAVGLVYGGFSSSTPDAIGIPEMLIGLLLVMIVGLRGAISPITSFTTSTRGSLLLPILQVSFLYLCIVPTVYGLAFNQVDPIDWVRDIIPFFYMFLPVLWIPLLRQNPQAWTQAIAYVLTVIGTLFAIRFFLIDDISIQEIGRAIMFGDMNYFPMDPAVTFAAVFSMLEGFRALESRSVRRSLIWFMLSAISLASLAAMMVRAPLILYSVVMIGRVLTLKARGFWGVSVKVITVISFLSISIVAVPLIELILAKMESVGLNAKDAEIQAVIDFVLSGPASLLFGTGWGGTFLSPAVGVQVRFVHNFSGYFLLKAGIVGLAIAALIVLRIYPCLVYRWVKAHKPSIRSYTLFNSLHAACFVALSSSFFLQANYKSLSFGLVLAIAMLTLDLFSITTNTQKIGQAAHLNGKSRESYSSSSYI